MRVIDLVGKRFGRLVVIRRIGAVQGNARWECVCDCGGIARTYTGNLKRGTATSCGCYSLESMKARRLTHGESRRKSWTPEYRAYTKAKERCTNPRIKNWKDYGGRGIRFCFTCFEDWLHELGRKPTPKHSVDRINANGNYEAGNLRWATQLQQRHNRRDSK